MAVAEKSTAAVVHARPRPPVSRRTAASDSPEKKRAASPAMRGSETRDSESRAPRSGVSRRPAANRARARSPYPASAPPRFSPRKARPVSGRKASGRAAHPIARATRAPGSSGSEAPEACLGREVGDRESGADAQGVPHATGGDRGDNEKQREGDVPGAGRRRRDNSAPGRHENASGGVGQEGGAPQCRGLPGVGPAGDTE